MIYQEAVEFLEQGVSNRIEPGLSRMQNILFRLGNPERRLKIIHVAGTNGKGSSCSMLSSILKAQGYRVGTYTSPHLQRYNERYAINGKEISDGDFIKYCARLMEAYKLMREAGEPLPTVFELLTALCFCYFADENVDYVVLEVGLGGRFDATNVVENPVLSMIAQIGMDHMDYLGSSVEQIAIEKCGIIKKNVPCVLYSQDEMVYNIVKDTCKQRNSELYYAEDTEIIISKISLDGTIFSAKNPYYDYIDINLGLLGRYQLKNCSFVLLAINALRDAGVEISEASVYNGLKDAVWHGRMEVLSRNPVALIDGAHNTDGILALSQSLEDYFSGVDITLVMGVLGDKEYKKMLDIIAPLASRIIFTEPESSRRLDAGMLYSLAENMGIEIYKEKNIDEAVRLALRITPEDGAAVFSGSLYMIGEVRRCLC